MARLESAWQKLVGELEELDWERIVHDETTRRRLTTAMQKVRQSPESLRDWVEHVATTDELFRDSARDSAYPQLFFDEFLVWRSKDDRARVRLHRFKTVSQNGGLREPVHNHKWHGFSCILSGEYSESRYERTTDGHGLNKIDEVTRRPGDIVLLEAVRTIHEVSVTGPRPCLSLFVRGPRVADEISVWERASRDEWVERKQPTRSENLRAALSAIGNGRDDFPTF